MIVNSIIISFFFCMLEHLTEPRRRAIELQTLQGGLKKPFSKTKTYLSKNLKAINMNFNDFLTAKIFM